MIDRYKLINLYIIFFKLKVFEYLYDVISRELYIVEFLIMYLIIDNSI